MHMAKRSETGEFGGRLQASSGHGLSVATH